MKILTTEAKRLREEIKKIVDKQKDDSLIDSKLSISVVIHENWYSKKHQVLRKDIANREKFLIDSVFDSLGIDDKYIFEHKLLKVQDEKEFAIIKISSILEKNHGRIKSL